MRTCGSVCALPWMGVPGAECEGGGLTRRRTRSTISAFHSGTLPEICSPWPWALADCGRSVSTLCKKLRETPEMGTCFGGERCCGALPSPALWTSPAAAMRGPSAIERGDVSSSSRRCSCASTDSRPTGCTDCGSSVLAAVVDGGSGERRQWWTAAVVDGGWCGGAARVVCAASGE